MLPHKSDSQLRRDGSDAALMQLPYAVDERGRLHGVPDLGLQRLPIHVCRPMRFTAIEQHFRRRILTATNAQLRRQDKCADRRRAHVVAWIVDFQPGNSRRCWRMSEIPRSFQWSERRRFASSAEKTR
jgi:hypothetical protein